MKTLEGKVAVVTGSARGIGAAIAERLAADGAAIAVNYLKSSDRAEGVAERIRRAGGRAIVLQADMGDWSQAKALVERTAKEFGRLDILVNNAAGLVGMEPYEQINELQTRWQFAVNVEGPIAAIQAAAALFPKEGGRIINISSIVTQYAMASVAVYTATKGALEALTRAFAVDLGPLNVTVNAVSVGLTETDAIRENMPEELKIPQITRTALRRIGTPSDIADVVALLASPDARWITGQVVSASGGLIP
jgi:3-oxoacyl-[acyl-carrier protein] reductase